MKDDPKGEVQLYQYFSSCLKLFMKKMMFATKIFHSDAEQLTRQLQQNLSHTLAQGQKLLDKFDQFFDDASKSQHIFSRFVLRVRQSVHNCYLKTSVPEIVNFLKFLESIIKQLSLSSSMKTFLRIILLKTPRKIDISIQNFQKEQKQFLSVPCSKPQASKLTKQNSLFDCYDKYLQALSIQYRIFNCLNIEQSHYRRSFFLALEDQNRKNNNLFEQMLYRNRYTKQSIQIYQKKLENSKRKALQKKSRLLLSQAEISFKQIKDKKSNSKILTSYKQRQPALIIFEPLNSVNNNRLVYNSKSILAPTRMKFMSSSFNREQFFGNKPKMNRNSNLMQLKKVQFKGSLIELVPDEQFDNKSPKQRQQLRRRKVKRQSNEELRKKMWLAREGGKERGGSWNKSDKNFGSIRINCKTEN